MSRHAFPAEPSAVADVPKAAAFTFAAAVFAAQAFAAAAFAAFDGARS
ncbi:hypothetical protein OG625_32730 [Streptomyces sp. NBC_01351]|nr:hypothetical protein [Streptomyces sp. NBC_01351]